VYANEFPRTLEAENLVSENELLGSSLIKPACLRPATAGPTKGEEARRVLAVFSVIPNSSVEGGQKVLKFVGCLMEVAL
jgi:hypothetical protein